jgi:hypothetical protein
MRFWRAPAPEPPMDPAAAADKMTRLYKEADYLTPPLTAGRRSPQFRAWMDAQNRASAFHAAHRAELDSLTVPPESVTPEMYRTELARMDAGLAWMEAHGATFGPSLQEDPTAERDGRLTPAQLAYRTAADDRQAFMVNYGPGDDGGPDPEPDPEPLPQLEL